MLGKLRAAAALAGLACAAIPVPAGGAAAEAAAVDGTTFRAGRRHLVERLARRAGIDPPPAGLPVYELFEDLVSKGARTGSTRPADPPDPRGVIRRLPSLPCSARDGEAEAAWLLRAAWGVEPAPVWSAGLAALETAEIYGRPPADLASALVASGLLPSLDELLEAPREIAQYPTLFAPAAHRLTSWILESHGSAGLRRAVEATVRRGGRAQALARALGIAEPALRAAYGEHSGGAGSAARPLPRSSVPAGFQRGVCYAHTVSLERGYASPRSGRSLDRLSRMGVNWISVTPFGYIELHEPRIAASSAFGPDAETDESLAEVIGQARERRLRVLMKPHLWSTDFVGLVAMRGEEDWRRFFRSYGRFLAHHAILAHACGASALCVGNELVEATRGRDAEWRSLIRAARALFSGPLTYGAHWDEEVERIRFWQDLDWVGVSLYAPLARTPGAAAEELAGAARQQAVRLGGIARRAGRPLVLVEAGFPSHPRAPLAPWEEPEDGPPDPRAQAAAFEALAAAFVGQPFLAGLYWWKWFTDDGASPRDRSHRFAGKPAEEVVRKFFSRR